MRETVAHEKHIVFLPSLSKGFSQLCLFIFDGSQYEGRGIQLNTLWSLQNTHKIRTLKTTGLLVPQSSRSPYKQMKQNCAHAHSISFAWGIGTHSHSHTIDTYLILPVLLRGLPDFMPTNSWFSLTSGLLSAISIAKPGPNPVNVFTLVDVGSGLRHCVKAENASDFRCWV